MIGEHTLTLHETNTRAYVPTCSCGWIGLAHATRAVQRTPKGRKSWGRDESRAAATGEYQDHAQRCTRPSIDRMNP